MEKRLMNVAELSEYLSMPKATIYSYVSLRRMPQECVRRIGRALRFEVAAVDAWVNGGLLGSHGESSPQRKTRSAPDAEPAQPNAPLPPA